MIGIDHSADQLAYARRLAEEEDLRVELRHEDLADLAFLPPASVDVAFSGSALTHVIDTGRVFRQVHRVLKTGAPFVFAVEHPAARLGAGAAYWSGYTISDLYGGFQRANFEVDTLLEPEVGAAAAPRSCRRRSSCEDASSACDARRQAQLAWR